MYPEKTEVSENKGQEVDVTNIEQAVDTTKRTLKGYQYKIFTVIALFMSLYHIYVLGFNPVTPWILYIVHVGLAAILVFLLYPSFGKSKSESVTVIDLIL